MGLLRSLFGNADRDLERVESLIDDGEVSKAIDLARRLLKADGGRLREQAAKMLLRATTAAIEQAEERATAMEEAGHLDDAVEWLEGALDRLSGADAELGSRRPEIEKRLDDLRGRAVEQSANELEEDLMAAAAVPAVEASSEVELEEELDEYRTLTDTLGDQLAQLYAEQPEAFRRAVVAISQGNGEAALGELETLDEKDPLVALERGRARLLMGSYREAREDFEAAWPTFGDEPLDHHGLLSLPLLWSDAAIGEGDSEAIVERLIDIEEARWASPLLTEHLARALIDCAREEEAIELLESATEEFVGQPVFPFLQASVLVDRSDPEAAIDLLESSVRASTRQGAGSPRIHPPSMELLVRLLIEHEGDPARAYELLNMAAYAAGGVTASLATLRARLLRRDGREEEAVAADSVAAKLAALEGDQPTLSDAPDLPAGKRPVL